MRNFEFIKMQALGNDFVVIDNSENQASIKKKEESFSNGIS